MQTRVRNALVALAMTGVIAGGAAAITHAASTPSNDHPVDNDQFEMGRLAVTGPCSGQC
jgi:hypothetical protein